MGRVIVISGLAIAAALGALQLAVLNNAPPPSAALETSQRAYADAIRLTDRPWTDTTPAEDAARDCEARARMAAAVHRADPAQVREACLFTWRSTGALPRP